MTSNSQREVKPEHKSHLCSRTNEREIQRELISTWQFQRAIVETITGAKTWGQKSGKSDKKTMRCRGKINGESQEMWMPIVLGHLEVDLGDTTFECYYVGWKQE